MVPASLAQNIHTLTRPPTSLSHHFFNFLREDRDPWSFENAPSLHFDTACTDPRVVVPTVEYMIHNSPQFASHIQGAGLYSAVAAGNLKTAAVLVKIAMSKSFGLSRLYADALTTATGKIGGVLQTRSVLKKARMYHDLTPLHVACINPNTVS